MACPEIKLSNILSWKHFVVFYFYLEYYKVHKQNEIMKKKMFKEVLLKFELKIIFFFKGLILNAF